MPGNDGGGPVSEGVRLLETMTYPEVGECIEANVPLLLPVGAVEQHGPHLPLGTDGLIPYELAKLVAGGGRAIVAPPMFYGAYSRPRTGGGRHFPGSVGLPGRSREAVVSGLVADWMRQGFRRVAVLNGHFENSWTLLEAVEQAIEPYTATHRPRLVGRARIDHRDDAGVPAAGPGPRRPEGRWRRHARDQLRRLPAEQRHPVAERHRQQRPARLGRARQAARRAAGRAHRPDPRRRVPGRVTTCGSTSAPTSTHLASAGRSS